MTTESGKLRNVATFHGMLDTGGDVYEAAEECYGMVQWLARQLAEARRALFIIETQGQLQADPADTVTRELIRDAQEHYKDGLAIGGVQED
jgi:hypothetical protein